jgi:hypothetical protein
MEIESAPGKGSRFMLLVPATPTDIKLSKEVAAIRRTAVTSETPVKDSGLR